MSPGPSSLGRCWGDRPTHLFYLLEFLSLSAHHCSYAICAFTCLPSVPISARISPSSTDTSRNGLGSTLILRTSFSLDDLLEILFSKW